MRQITIGLLNCRDKLTVRMKAHPLFFSPSLPPLPPLYIEFQSLPQAFFLILFVLLLFTLSLFTHLSHLTQFWPVVACLIKLQPQPPHYLLPTTPGGATIDRSMIHSLGCMIFCGRLADRGTRYTKCSGNASDLCHFERSLQYSIGSNYLAYTYQ